MEGVNGSYYASDVVKAWAKENNVQVSAAQHSQLALHQHMILETNKHMNLTAITDPIQFAIKHIIDSLTLLPYIQAGATVADIGSGAGFPGLVLSIMRSDIQVTLVDSLRKRVNFLQTVIDALELPNVVAIHSRAEDMPKDAFDITTARAVATLDKLVKWVLPITKPGGVLLAMKGPDVADEVTNAKTMLDKYGGSVKSVHSVEIAPGLRHSVIEIAKKLQ